MSGKFHWLVAATLLITAATCGCHTIGGVRYHDVGGACQKGACQKSVCQKGGCGCDGGYRGGHLLSSIHGMFWGSEDCGCGECYWNEWQYDPPDCCDPCDDCYGCYVGPRDCCGRKFIIDPVLWVLAIKGKHCRGDGWYDPCGDWHCYGDGTCGCDGNCGCGKGGCGSSYGDTYMEGEIFEAPGVDMVPPPGAVDEVPDPTPVPAVRTGRVASNADRGETRQASHELRR